MLLKDFKQLVNYCRTVGVLTYKSGDLEFTLSAEDPKDHKRTVRKLQKVQDSVDDKLANLSDEDLLLYSSQGIPPETSV